MYILQKETWFIYIPKTTPSAESSQSILPGSKSCIVQDNFTFFMLIVTRAEGISCRG